MPGVTYTERTVTESTYTEGIPVPVDDGFALFGMPIPLFGASGVADITATYVERTVPSTSFTERPVTSTTYTERTV